MSPLILIMDEKGWVCKLCRTDTDTAAPVGALAVVHKSATEKQLVTCYLWGQFTNKTSGSKCRYTGKPQMGKIQYLLVTLRNEASVLELLQCAPPLQNSSTDNKIFITPDRMPARALAAYQVRVQQRLYTELKRSRKEIFLTAKLTNFFLMLLYSRH